MVDINIFRDRMKKKIAKKKREKKRLKSPIKPIYDDVYFQGVEYLDRLARTGEDL